MKLRLCLILLLAWTGVTLAGDALPAKAACCAQTASPDGAEKVLPAESIYQLESDWLDAQGVSRRLSDFAGPVQVLAMFFTRCEYACPRILAELNTLADDLRPDEQVEFLLVSFDSEKDTPESLATFAREQGLAPERWQLLHGTAEAVRELSVVLDVAYTRLPDGMYSHASVIHVLDGQGRVLYQKQGLGGELDECKEVIHATAEKNRHSEARWKEPGSK